MTREVTVGIMQRVQASTDSPQCQCHVMLLKQYIYNNDGFVGVREGGRLLEISVSGSHGGFFGGPVGCGDVWGLA